MAFSPTLALIPPPFSTGITAQISDCWMCCWAWKADGLMHLKHVNSMCPSHGGLAR